MSALRRVMPHLLSLALVCAAATPTEADIIAYSFQEVGAFASPSDAATQGFLFIPTVPIEVTALGYFDHNQDGLTLIHPVGIFDALTQELLAVTNVGPGSVLEDLFRYNPISPLSLEAGHPYMLAGFHPGSDTEDFGAFSLPASLLFGGVVTAPQLIHQGFFFEFGNSLTFPTTGPDPNAFFFGPNLQFQVQQVQAIPEPSTVSLLGLGIAALAVWHWHRRRSAINS